MSMPSLFAYVGPDTFLPVTSVISALVGALMCLWGTGTRTVMRGFVSRFRRDAPSGAPTPALARRRRAAAPAEAPAAGPQAVIESKD